jgi:predicted dehydrogenase
MLKIPVRLNKKLKWGVAGCGKYTEETFLPTLQQLSKSKLISVYSSDPLRAKSIAEKFGAVNHTSDYDEFLKGDFDAVYIAGANSVHHMLTIKAAQAGKHILCEKPLALNSAEAEEMVKVCAEKNVKLAVNYVFRFHPLTVKAKEIIEKGMLGKIVSINASFNVDYAPNENFRFQKNLSGGGALRDIGTHMIDLLRVFGGEIEDLKGFSDNIIYKSEVDDFSAGIVKFHNGGYGYFNASFNNKKAPNRIEILGYEGYLSIEGLIGRRRESAKLVINLHGETKKAFRKRANKLIHLLRSVQNSFLYDKPLQITGEDGLINMKLMEKLEGR